MRARTLHAPPGMMLAGISRQSQSSAKETFTTHSGANNVGLIDIDGGRLASVSIRVEQDDAGRALPVPLALRV